MLAALEHQVLEQVREARLPGPLVLRTDVIPDVDGDDRGLVILVHDQRQSVVEHEALVRNRVRARARRVRGARCGRSDSDGGDQCGNGVERTGPFGGQGEHRERSRRG